MKRIIISMFALSVLCSCEKGTSDKEITFPQALSPKSLTVESEVKVYVNGIELNDAALKQRFEQRYDMFRLGDEFVKKQQDLLLISTDTLLFGSSLDRRGISKSGDRWLLNSDPYINNPYSGQEAYVEEYLRSLSKFRWEESLPSGQRNRKWVSVAYGNEHALEVPLYTYLFKMVTGGADGLGGGVSYEQYPQIVFNEFNDEPVKLRVRQTLENSRDTLVVKQYRLHFVAEL